MKPLVGLGIDTFLAKTKRKRFLEITIDDSLNKFFKTNRDRKNISPAIRQRRTSNLRNERTYFHIRYLAQIESVTHTECRRHLAVKSLGDRVVTVDEPSMKTTTAHFKMSRQEYKFTFAHLLVPP